MSTIDAPAADRNLLVETRQQRQAQELLAMTGTEFTRLTVTSSDQELIAVPTSIVGIVQDVVSAIASGARISIAALPDELTTTIAAEQLGISRPTLMKMIGKGEIPAHKVGSHHRLKTEDIVEFKKRRLEWQRRALAELREIDAELDDF